MSGWEKGDEVTLKGWQITPVKGWVVETRPDGSLLVDVPGGRQVWLRLDEVHPRRPDCRRGLPGEFPRE
jgi:hypothetical protein